MPRVYIRDPNTKELVRIIDDERCLEFIREEGETEASFKVRFYSELKKTKDQHGYQS